MRRLRRLGLDPVPTSREEVLRKSTQFSPAAMVNMFCLLLPTSYIPTTSFFHDFSGAAFNNDERSLLGLGINYGLPPVTAFNTDPVFGVKEDFTFFTTSGSLKGNADELKVEDYWYLAPVEAAVKKLGKM